MGRIVLTLTVCVLAIAIVKCFEYEDDELLYDDDIEEEGRSLDIKPPIYDLKDAPNIFKRFIKDYHKEYKDKEEYEKRYKTFVSNLKYINEINQEGRSSVSDINMFSDLDNDELDDVI